MFFERLAHFVIRRRWWVVGTWIALLFFGFFATSRLSGRWFESFSIPGYSAYESNQRALKTFGTGEQAPLLAVFQSKGDVTGATGIQKAVLAGAAVNPGSRVSSWFNTHSDVYLSNDRRTTFAEIYPPGTPGFNSNENIKKVRAAIKAQAPEDLTVHLTGRDALEED